MPKKKSSVVLKTAPKTRIPPEVSGLQVNFCKNPRCENFGVPALQTKRTGPKGKTKDPDQYHVTGGVPNAVLRCRAKGCTETLLMKSNAAILEELDRMEKYLEGGRTDPAIHEPDCPHYGVGFYVDRSLFTGDGVTPTRKTPRYKCKVCGGRFTDSSSVAYHKQAHKNKWIFKLLMNKVPFRRICELVDIDTTTLYNKIDFLHQQCMNFAAHREMKLFGMKKDRFYVCVDRQDHTVNWTDSNDRANVILNALGSADMGTGYIFGIHLNFDADKDSGKINDAAKLNDDVLLPRAWREYARLWLQLDYDQAEEANKKIRDRKAAAKASVVAGTAPAPPPTLGDGLLDDLVGDYAETEEREDTESSEVMTSDVKLPQKYGMQVREDYTMYAHFMLLHRMFKNVEKVRFYMDKDSGIRAAFHTAFWKEIKEAHCEGFFVKTNKMMTVDQKYVAYAKAAKKFRAFKAKPGNPGLKYWQLRIKLIREEMDKMKAIGKWEDRWLKYPFANMGEPEKAVCYLTDIGTYDGGEDEKNHMAWLYYKANMHPINRFFMQARRRVSLLERPIHSASSTGRTWHGYSSYNPDMIQQLLDIFRVFYNYMHATERPILRKRKRLLEKMEESGVFEESESSETAESTKKAEQAENLVPVDPAMVPTPPGETDPDAGENSLAYAIRPVAPEVLPDLKLTTPAMRLGLARAPVTYEDILYFK